MAQVRRHRRAIAAALFGLAVLYFAPAPAQDHGSKDATDLYDRPVLTVDPGMHTGAIWAQAIDAEGRYAVTGGEDRTVRIWSVADGKLLRTIWIPVGPDPVGTIRAVAISPDGSTIAAGGWTEKMQGGTVVYLFDRESGALLRRIPGLRDGTSLLTFSPDGRYLAATLAGLHVFDRNNDFSEAFRDDGYGDVSYGAAFAPDGRFATTSYDGKIRLYAYDPNSRTPNFSLIGQPFSAGTGLRPRGLSFNHEGTRLAVGYTNVAAVDVLDARTFRPVGGQSPANATANPDGLASVAWSGDGRTLYAAGGVNDAQGNFLLFAWNREYLGGEWRMTYCAQNTATGVNVLPDGRILVASIAPCLGLMDTRGAPIWTAEPPILDFRNQTDMLKVSRDGKVVDFGDTGSASAPLRFDLGSLALSPAPPNDDATLPPNRARLTIDGWRVGTHPTLGNRMIPLHRYEITESLAIASDAKRFVLGSSFGLIAFDDEGKQKWRRPTRAVVLAVNASRDGRVVVSAESDGTIRWRRTDDGRELLALQVLPNRKDWVLWTPEGFYESTDGAKDVLKWVTNHGPDKPASTLPVFAIPKLHRPDALPLVLDQLETARALGIADVEAARLAVQTATGSAKPPGGTLHVLAIGIDTFGKDAGGLHLDYAAEDAHDVANALTESQKGAPGKPSLYSDVSLQYLPNEKASKTAIEDALDAMAESMAKSVADQDTAVILVSSHGEMIGGQFYLIPYGFVANGTRNAATDSAISASVFAEKVSALAAYGKVLVLLDACHSGAIGAGGWATDPSAKVLQDAMDLENVTVLTSSKRNELSEELPEWKHGALAQAFLDALTGAADSMGIVTRSALTDAMETEVQSLTKGRQHLGMHVNFSGDLFVAGHY